MLLRTLALLAVAVAASIDRVPDGNPVLFWSATDTDLAIRYAPLHRSFSGKGKTKS
jgi:hypothetical protein